MKVNISNMVSQWSGALKTSADTVSSKLIHGELDESVINIILEQIVSVAHYAEAIKKELNYALNKTYD